jgi:hypothetical protein
MASAIRKPAGPALVRDEPPTQKPKPTRPLPFDRVTVAKQLDILRGYAAASAQGTKPVSNVEVASFVKMAAETISTCNAFFANIGLIQKGERGWIVSAEVVAFFRAFEWNKLTAAHNLAPLMEPSWFGQALIPRLSMNPMEENEAIEKLAAAAPAGIERKRALKMLIEWLESSGLVKRDGTQLKSVTLPVTEQPRQEVAREPANEPPARPRVATAFSQMKQGTMRFNVSFDVDLSEMQNWQADRLAAFFSGIAQVLAAKAEVEKTAKD